MGEARVIGPSVRWDGSELCRSWTAGCMVLLSKAGWRRLAWCERLWCDRSVVEDRRSRTLSSLRQGSPRVRNAVGRSAYGEGR